MDDDFDLFLPQTSCNCSQAKYAFVPRTLGKHCGGGVAAAASLDDKVCGRKPLGLSNNGKHFTLWCDQEVRESIRAKKVAYETWFHNNAVSLYSRYAEARNPAALAVKKIQTAILGEFRT